MSRPVAHNRVSEPINGSIVNGDDVGNIVYTVDGAGNDYPGGYADRTWVPSAEGAAPIVFVTDTFTQGYTGDPAEAVPIFFACAGTSSAAIIYTANRLPGMEGQDFGSVEEALTYLTRNGYFILEGNDPFEGINADSLALDLDASKMSSYPGGDTAWYDLSGNYRPADLINSPTFNSGGWFNLDGTDDRIQRTSNILTTTTGTVVMWLRTTDQTWLMIEGNTTSYYLGAIYLGGAWYNNACGSPSYYVDTKSSTNPTSEGYIDGRFHMFEAKNVDLSGWTTHQFLDYGGGSSFNMTGDVAKIQMYNRNLTAAESKQNYFGAPIVTDGLVFAVDANNIVSYPKSGTAWYNLTGSVPSASLFNSPIFTLPNGGAIDFDGTDDFATTPSTTISGDQTLCAWGVAEGPPNSPAGVITQHDYASTANFGINYVQNSGYRFGASIGYTNGTREFDSKVTNYTVQEGVIWNVVLVYSSSNNTIYWYVNGQLDSTYALSATPKSTNWPIGLGRWDPSYPAYYFTGKIFNSKIYNRALSAAEVQQNYQAEQYRFDYADGSTAAKAAPSAAYLWSMGVRTNGLYYINTLSGGPVQVYCDFTTLDANGESGWMLVGSWDNSYTWTLSANSSNSVFGSTPLNCVSSNFGNNPINQFRVQVASTVDSGGASADADFYYNWSNNTIMWKEVWAPDGTLTYYYLSQGSNPAVARASIKQFDNSYNIKGGYNNPNHKWNNISDYGYQNTPLPGGIAAVGGPSAPSYGLCPFWTALTTSGNTFGVYCMSRTSNFSTCSGPDADGTLAIPTNGAGTDTTGQDVDSNVSAKYGYDDGVLWQSPANNKMWWWIK